LLRKAQTFGMIGSRAPIVVSGIVVQAVKELKAVTIGLHLTVGNGFLALNKQLVVVLLGLLNGRLKGEHVRQGGEQETISVQAGQHGVLLPRTVLPPLNIGNRLVGYNQHVVLQKLRIVHSHFLEESLGIIVKVLSANLFDHLS